MEALKKFCKEVGMEVNVDKTKVVVFSLKRKTAKPQIKFNKELLDIMQSYKYLGLEFNERLNWEQCTKKTLQEMWKATFLLQNKCRTAEIWYWNIISSLFQRLITPVFLYGCEVWGTSISRSKWIQTKKVQKVETYCNILLETKNYHPRRNIIG